MFRVDDERVHHLARNMSLLPLAGDFADQVTPRVRASREAALQAFLWAAAICHSTKGGLKGYFGGTYYSGWDYLLRAFCHAAEDSESVVSPTHVTGIAGDELRDLLVRYAEHPQVTLPDIERRAALLNGCANELRASFDGSASGILDRALNRVGGETGAYSQLGQLTAFRDPLQKKSSAFLMTVHFSRLWKIMDQENVVAMIDYHRIRVMCRTGCIIVDDRDLLEALVTQRPVSETVEERLCEAAAEVCRSAVRMTGMAMFEFDVLLWAHARSCCRHHPVCRSGKLENDSFYRYVAKDFDGTCEFQQWCSGFRDVTIRGIWEPAVQTEKY